jgi:hypothetical protein
MQNRADMGGTRCGNKIKQESEKGSPRVSADQSDTIVASRFSRFLLRARNMEIMRIGDKRARRNSSHEHLEAKQEMPVKRLKEEEAVQE